MSEIFNFLKLFLKLIVMFYVIDFNLLYIIVLKILFLIYDD